MATAMATPATAPAPAATTAPAQNSSLYVGDLDRDATEASLYEMFSQVGPVASIRVCRDAVTRRSLGYAYVNYNSALDPTAAERALESLNYAVMAGRPIRIMWSHRDPAFRKSGVGNIFIKNLDKSIDNKALHDTFSQFGTILSCKVATDPTGSSKGYGFVHFESEEAANLAIENVNGMQLQDKIVFVGPFLKRTDRGDSRESKFTNLYVKGLPDDLDDEGLRALAAEYGEVTSALVMRDDAGKSRGFGFVNYEEPEAAAKASESLTGKEVNGKTLYAGRAQKKAEREAMLKAKFDEVRAERIAKYQGMNLYIKNLADDVTDEVLREEFGAYGTITSAKVMDDKGKSKGFGFVCYASPDEATRAVTEMNQKMLRGKPLYVALAQRKEVRRVQLAQQLQQQRLAMAAGRGGPGGPIPGMGFPPPGAPPMFYPGPGMAAGPRGAPGLGMYPGMMPGPGGRMGGGGRGGRGPPMGVVGPGGMVGPAGPLGGMGGRGGPMPGRGGRGGRGVDMMGGADGRGRGFERGGRGRGRGRVPPGAAMTMPVTAQPASGVPPPPMPPPMPPPTGATGVPPPLMPPPEPAPVSLPAMLAAAPPEQQKQILGERLFPQVAGLKPDLAGKITGMLLEMDNSEVLLLLDNQEALVSKVEEAIDVLKQHNVLSESGSQ